jgi:hypothetical protein
MLIRVRPAEILDSMVLIFVVLKAHSQARKEAHP